MILEHTTGTQEDEIKQAELLESIKWEKLKRNEKKAKYEEVFGSNTYRQTDR